MKPRKDLTTLLSLAIMVTAILCSTLHVSGQGRTLSLEKYESDGQPYIVLTLNDAAQRLNWIPAGDFMMGSPETEKHRDKNETLHKVTLTKGFWMADTEVTQALWETVMKTNPSNFNGKDRPVENVSWYDADSFLNEVNKLLTASGNSNFQAALPTEAQWEYACRAGTQTAYNWGEEPLPGYANDDNSFADIFSGFNKPRGENIDLFREKGLRVHSTMPVKTFEPNAWGLYDMHGNVFEWTRDLWGEYSLEDTIDPLGPSLSQDSQKDHIDNHDSASNPERRVIKGGAWYFSKIYSRSAYRYGDPADPERDENGRFIMEGWDRLGFRFILEEMP